MTTENRKNRVHSNELTCAELAQSRSTRYSSCKASLGTEVLEIGLLSLLRQARKLRPAHAAIARSNQHGVDALGATGPAVAAAEALVRLALDQVRLSGAADRDSATVPPVGSIGRSGDTRQGNDI